VGGDRGAELVAVGVDDFVDGLGTHSLSPYGQRTRTV
jgi:hypothetical protein